MQSLTKYVGELGMWDTLCFTVLVHLQLHEKIFRLFCISAEGFPFSPHWFWLKQNSKYNRSRLVPLFSSITVSIVVVVQKQCYQDKVLDKEIMLQGN